MTRRDGQQGAQHWNESPNGFIPAQTWPGGHPAPQPGSGCGVQLAGSTQTSPPAPSRQRPRPPQVDPHGWSKLAQKGGIVVVGDVLVGVDDVLVDVDEVLVGLRDEPPRTARTKPSLSLMFENTAP